MGPHDPDLPKDPAEYRPRPLMGLGFWAMIAFGVLCVLAGAGVALLAPRLWSSGPGPRHAPTPAAAPVERQPAPAPSSMAEPAAGEVARLNARIAALETQGARSNEAAAAALALAELVEATRGSRPFGRELAALRAAAPGLPELTALSRLAETGAPSRTALAASFPDYAARAASRAHKPAPDAGLAARLAYSAAKVVSLRRVDDIAGPGADARIARAEQALQEGEVAIALTALEGLPPKSRDALAPWWEGAERRAGIDRETAALRRRVLRDLGGGEPPP